MKHLVPFALDLFRFMRLAFACALLSGCQTWLEPSDDALQSLLKPIETAPDSVTVEIFHVRIPLDLQREADRLWAKVDEQQIDAQIRSNLAENGLRAGTVVQPLPEELTAILALTDKPAEAVGEQVVTTLTARPRVTRRIVQLGRDEQTPIPASEVRERVQVILNDRHGLHGKEYTQVEAIYSLKGTAQPGQQVRLSLVPELHHGELRNRRIGSNKGIFMMTASREREAFLDMQITADLAAGEMLVLGSLPHAGCSLGQAFHSSETAGRKEQKLILVRLLQVPPSEILADRR